MLLDIVILPPPHIRKRVGEISKKIGKKYKLTWAVDNKKLIPHISLYHLSIAPNSLTEIFSGLQKLSLFFKPTVLTYIPPRFYGKSIWVGFNRTKALRKMSRRMVYTFLKFQSGSLGFIPSTKLEVQYLNKYGSPFIFQNFWPHVTIGKVKSLTDKHQILDCLVKNKLSSFKCDTIALTETNKNHQVTKILKIFKLKNKSGS